MIRALFISTLILSGCTIFSPQTELDSNLDPTKDYNIEIVLNKGNFLTTGWTCAEMNGWPAFVHPVIITLFGCVEYYWKDGAVYKCEVWYSSEWALRHEITHCFGYIDNEPPRTIKEGVKVK